MSQNTFKELPLSRLRPDSGHILAAFGSTDADLWLLRSIEQYGLLSPILVEAGSHRIVDGHRRYLAAKALELESVLCTVCPKLGRRYEATRFMLNNTTKPWTKAGYAAWRRKQKEDGLDISADFEAFCT